MSQPVDPDFTPSFSWTRWFSRVFNAGAHYKSVADYEATCEHFFHECLDTELEMCEKCWLVRRR